MPCECHPVFGQGGGRGAAREWEGLAWLGFISMLISHGDDDSNAMLEG